jgi:serine/threonine protein kinase
MAVQPLDHPDLARLAAFGRGVLDDEEMAEVETHLAECELCCQVLSTIPDDEFVDSLRRAEGHFDSDANLRRTAKSSPPRSESPDAPDFEVALSYVPPGSHSSSELGETLSAGDLDNPETPGPHSELDIPAELADHPRYRIVKRLGSGGMGTVYLAEHRLMDRSVALKVIRSDLLGNETMVERFRREVRAAARLALHPNIVAAYDAEQAGDSHFLVMEFVEGVDLAHLVKTRGPLPCALACRAVKQAAEGLEHALQRGMVHRDIKPQNLMLTPDGRVKILDFGLARFASETLPDLLPPEREAASGAEARASDRAARITFTDMVLGTADYIAPEQVSAPRSADIRADVYSLGCTLYYLLTGHAPFPEGTLVQKLKAHSEQTPRPLTEARPNVPPSLALIVERMLTKDRSLRFQRPSEVAEALAPFADAVDFQITKEGDTQAVEVPSDSAGERGSPPRLRPSFKARARTRGAWISRVALVALFVGSIGLFLARPPFWPPGSYAGFYGFWPASAPLLLLFGYAGFFGMDAIGWPGIALVSLFAGFMALLCLEPPGWPWAAHLSLLVCCLRGLGMITVRQLSYAFLCLLIGFEVSFGLTRGWPKTALVSLLVGSAGPLVIITLRELDGLAPLWKLRVWACLAMLFAVCAAGIAYARGHDVETRVHGEGLLLTENDTLLLVRSPSTGRLADLRAQQGDWVDRGLILGRISQPDLVDAIRELDSMLADLRRVDQEPTQFRDRDRLNKGATSSPLEQAAPKVRTDNASLTFFRQRIA